MSPHVRSAVFVCFIGTPIIFIYLLLSSPDNSDHIHYYYYSKVKTNFTENIVKIRNHINNNNSYNSNNDNNNNNNVVIEKSIKQRGKFWVLYNFIEATETIDFNQTITLTTPSDYRYLNNIEQLIKIWNGPISVCLYAPGYDFYTTLDSIAYLRNCCNDLIKQFVTFHLFFDNDHLPKTQDNERITETYKDEYNCTNSPPYANIKDEDMYKSKNRLTFPINVARNIARESAKTYFVFPSDIELFPTPDFIKKFLEFSKRKTHLFEKDQRNVYVLPIFEILNNQSIPQTKRELQQLYKEKKAFLFHQKICWQCHKIPNFEKWIKQNETNNKQIDIFTIGKRYDRNAVWEPFFISTNDEPLFDERLTWEGESNKMSQAFALCLLNYNFMVLDNAFLTHRPGIKKKKIQAQKHQDNIRKTKKILRDIKDNLIRLYGDNKKCKITSGV